MRCFMEADMKAEQRYIDVFLKEVVSPRDRVKNCYPQTQTTVIKTILWVLLRSYEFKL